MSVTMMFDWFDGHHEWESPGGFEMGIKLAKWVACQSDPMPVLVGAIVEGLRQSDPMHLSCSFVGGYFGHDESITIGEANNRTIMPGLWR